MPPKRRYYSAGVKEALFMLSRGRCYVPTCQERVLRMVDGEPSINVQTAHIRAHSANGPRFDPDFPESKRGDFENLILLCMAHHTPVDKKANEAKYPTELLLEWKEQREGDFGAELDGLDFISEDTLASMMTDAVADTKTEIMSAIDELGAHVNDQTAQLLHSFLAETFDRPYLDLDAVAQLADAARNLQHLPDSATALNQAARQIGNLEDGASSLNMAARQIGNLEDGASHLRTAAEQIRSAGHAATPSWDVGDTSNLDSSTRELSKVTERIEHASRSLAESDNHTVIHVDDQQRWKYFKAGLGVGLVLAIVVAVFVAQNQQPGADDSARGGADYVHSATGS